VKKIILPLMLLSTTAINAALIGIMDSGTDMSHRDLTTKAWINTNESQGDVDKDGDGLPGNVFGWDFITNSSKPYDDQYNYLIDEDVRKFYEYYAKYELRTVQPQEIQWLREKTNDAVFMNKVNFIGGYAHGTHVAGIAVKNSANAKVLPMKVIPTVYTEVSPDEEGPHGASKDTSKEPGSSETQTAPKLTIEQLKSELVLEAQSQIKEMQQIHKNLDFHKVDVTNQSFGIGYHDAEGFIKNAFIETIGREPSKEELDQVVRHYINALLTFGPSMYAASPNNLFVVAAGNDSSNNDLFPDYPANIQADNKIVVAATLGYQKMADFSNFGATKVDVAAPGVAILSSAPTNISLHMSGTSQATPFVTNVIAEVKDMNPKLSAKDIKKIVLGTVDVKFWLKGRVATSGIVNKARSLKAAELSLTLSLDEAITKAKSLVNDVAINKSLNLDKNLGFKLKFRPTRPSLLQKI